MTRFLRNVAWRLSKSSQGRRYLASIVEDLPVESLVKEVYSRRNIFSAVYRHAVPDKPGLHVFNRPVFWELNALRITAVLHGLVSAVKKEVLANESFQN